MSDLSEAIDAETTADARENLRDWLELAARNALELRECLERAQRSSNSDEKRRLAAMIADVAIIQARLPKAISARGEGGR